MPRSEEIGSTSPRASAMNIWAISGTRAFHSARQIARLQATLNASSIYFLRSTMKDHFFANPGVLDLFTCPDVPELCQCSYMKFCHMQMSTCSPIFKVSIFCSGI